MFKSIKSFFRSVKARAKSACRRIRASVRSFLRGTRVNRVLCGTAAEAYVDTGVKILIAVVIGALLLGGLYALFNTTIMPNVTSKITELFNYKG